MQRETRLEEIIEVADVLVDRRARRDKQGVFTCDLAYVDALKIAAAIVNAESLEAGLRLEIAKAGDAVASEVLALQAPIGQR